MCVCVCVCGRVNYALFHGCVLRDSDGRSERGGGGGGGARGWEGWAGRWS